MSGWRTDRCACMLSPSRCADGSKPILSPSPRRHPRGPPPGPRSRRGLWGADAIAFALARADRAVHRVNPPSGRQVVAGPGGEGGPRARHPSRRRSIALRAPPKPRAKSVELDRRVVVAGVSPRNCSAASTMWRASARFQLSDYRPACYYRRSRDAISTACPPPVEPCLLIVANASARSGLSLRPRACGLPA